MSGGGFSLDDYVDVAERIEMFKAAHPDGSLQSEVVELRPDLVVMRGIAYRSPDDARPGIGHSMLAIPGTTPYTRGSEVENAETSAWGRAIAALGFAVRKGGHVASRQEVRNKQGDPGPSRPSPELARRSAAAGGGFWAGRLGVNEKPSSAYSGFLREDRQRGPSVGFQLSDLDPSLLGRTRANVLCVGALAIGVAAGLEGRRPEHATVWGTAREEAFESGGKTVRYTVIDATRVMTDDWTVPAEGAPAGAQELIDDLDNLAF